MKTARLEPVLADPEINGEVTVKPHHLFLLIYSQPLAECVAALIGGEKLASPNEIAAEICRLTLEQFAENSTVCGVAQGVVDKVVRTHRETLEFSGHDSLSREDMTLLVRNFNAHLGRRPPGQQMQQQQQPPLPAGRPLSSSGDSGNHLRTKTGSNGGLPSDTNHSKDTATSDNARTATPSRYPRATSTTTESSADAFNIMKQAFGNRTLSVDDNNQIKPYVDFTYFHRKWNQVHGSATEVPGSNTCSSRSSAHSN